LEFTLLKTELTRLMQAMGLRQAPKSSPPAVSDREPGTFVPDLSGPRAGN